MSKEKRCENDAVIRYLWPGQGDKLCCIEHAQQIKNVANAMGCNVSMYPITPDFIGEERPKCSSFTKDKEPAAAPKAGKGDAA